MKMNPRLASLIAAMIASAPLLSASEVERLRALVAEQEIQIQQLELKVAQLSNHTVTSSPKTTPVSTTEVSKENPPVAGSKTYTIQSGDNMVSIARKHGTTSAILNELNGLDKNSIIRPGQVLKLPETASTTEESSTKEEVVATVAEAPVEQPSKPAIQHKVADKETYYSIAKKYGVSVNELEKQNPKINPRALRIGQVVEIPEKQEALEKTETVATTDHVPTLGGPNHTSTVSTGGQLRASEKPIRITKEISYSEFAKNHNTTTSRLDELNGLRLDPTTILAQGSELYIPE
jgi:LysM repeat protein